MSGSHDLFLDLVAASAVGSIEPRDRPLLEEHLAGGCPECLAQLRELSAPLEALALALPAARPSRGLKARVLVAAAQAGWEGAEASDPSAGRARRRPRGLPWPWAAVLLGAAVLGWWRANVVAQQRDDLETRLGPYEERARVAPTPEESLSRFLAATPGARAVLVSATPDGDPARSVRAAYDPATRRLALVFSNFKAPPGKDFELWTLRTGGPVSEGLVRPDADGRAFLLVEVSADPSGLESLAVSLEPLGGSPSRRAPSGRIHYAGKVG